MQKEREKSVDGCVLYQELSVEMDSKIKALSSFFNDDRYPAEHAGIAVTLKSEQVVYEEASDRISGRYFG